MIITGLESTVLVKDSESQVRQILEKLNNDIRILNKNEKKENYIVIKFTNYYFVTLITYITLLFFIIN